MQSIAEILNEVVDGTKETEKGLKKSKSASTGFLEELKGLKKVNKNVSSDLTTRLKHIVTSIDGDYEKKTIREFVDNEFLARDARELRNYIKKIQPSVDLSYEYEDQRGNITTIDIPVGINFFWPDATV